MAAPRHERTCDAFHLHESQAEHDRGVLDEVFKAGRRAREEGVGLEDNPYAPGTEEREEWRAGWTATVEIDRDGEDGNYQKS